ncbi:hypothetical protein P255_01006 [Acinetobacter brisouii CIP 110357]|uniref:Uncharacterized protein n=1 Tax=Acinetobacter brisouii CIP 110357 TaxID=1341683 RepID=V2UTH9_9GAMM|nr:hypothetical protein F954_01194 [Acinetobacter brisouii ANC 4119]ESK51911.1 hypothetical protein P255_01006 [Acinetobacter brisouii CIP 110357]
MTPRDFLICMIILIIFCLITGASSYSTNHALGFL